MHRVNQLHTASLRVAGRPKLEAEYNQRDYRPHHVWPRLASGKWTDLVRIWRFSQRCNWGGYLLYDRGYEAVSMVKHIQTFRGALLPSAPRVMFSKNRIFGPIQLQNEFENAITQQSCQAVWMLPIVLCVVYYATTWPIRFGTLAAFSSESQNRPSFPDPPCGSTLQYPSPAPLISTRTSKTRSSFSYEIWCECSGNCFITLCFVTIFFVLWRNSRTRAWTSSFWGLWIAHNQTDPVSLLWAASVV